MRMVGNGAWFNAFLSLSFYLYGAYSTRLASRHEQLFLAIQEKKKLFVLFVFLFLSYIPFLSYPELWEEKVVLFSGKKGRAHGITRNGNGVWRILCCVLSRRTSQLSDLRYCFSSVVLFSLSALFPCFTL